MTKNKNPTPIALNAQVLINCQQYSGGSCQGGNPGDVYQDIFDKGIPDSSCEQYVAANGDMKCTAKEICKDCTWPPCPAGQNCDDKCWAVQHKTYYAKNYYQIFGAIKMKADIAMNGPISCGVHASPEFEAYTGGIFRQKDIWPQLNHEISVVGWGVDEKGEEYWIGRNSWGTYWGENGFFRVAVGSDDNIGIEEDCSAGIPSFTHHGDESSKDLFIQ